MGRSLDNPQDWLAFYAAGAICFFPMAMIAWPEFGRAVMKQIRQRAALVICAGAAIAAGAFLFGRPRRYSDTLFQEWLGNGVIAGFGLAIVLFGIYFWLTEVAPSRRRDE